jgi:CRISPR system Cascade subunit CasC
MKTLIEIHALQNFAPSNLNRDDTGAPKDAFFGGTRRARVSSQCDKRAIRQYFDQKMKEGVFNADELAVRTKRVYQAIADRLDGRREKSEALAKAEISLSYVKLKVAEGGKTQYLLFLGQREITKLADTIHECWDQIVPATEESGEKGKGKTKKAAASGAPKEIQERIDSVFNGGKAVDIALFGRMLADMPDKNQHAACQVAHAISTHAVEREFDFYTAVDDLKPRGQRRSRHDGHRGIQFRLLLPLRRCGLGKIGCQFAGRRRLGRQGLARFSARFRGGRADRKTKHLRRPQSA